MTSLCLSPKNSDKDGKQHSEREGGGYLDGQTGPAVD